MKKLSDFMHRFRRTSFMSFIGGLFIGVYLFMALWQLGQINWFFGKGVIQTDIYERMIDHTFGKLIEIVMIIVLFFFKNQATPDPKGEQAPTVI